MRNPFHINGSSRPFTAALRDYQIKYVTVGLAKRINSAKSLVNRLVCNIAKLT